MAQPDKRVSLFTATSLVIAAMIGTGVFTSLGFQVVYVESVFSILMLWVVGGITALCGALAYGELGAALPRSGGEYHLMSRIYHPAAGFLSGWVSALLGFAAPAALAAMAFASYFTVVIPIGSETHLAAAIVVLIGLVHLASIKSSVLFHDFFTVIKLVLILLFIIAAFLIQTSVDYSAAPVYEDLGMIFSSGFAISLVFVSYSYTGWNSAVYIVNEIKDPQKNLPLSLLYGTVVVLILYVLLNFAFLHTVPMAELEGKIEIGFLSASAVFGPGGAWIMSLVIAILLISTLSAFIFIGPRVTEVMGEDYHILKFLKTRSANGVPVNAIIFQTLFSLIFIYTSTFEQVFIYAGFILTLITTITVAGVFVLRFNEPELPRRYKTWGYPFTPAIFLGVNIWVLFYIVVDKPLESVVGIAIVLSGLILYYINKKISPHREYNRRYLSDKKPK